MISFFHVFVYSVSTDCQQLIKFASDLGMNMVQPIMFNNLKINCCNTTLVTCNASQNITRLDWSNLNLNGTLYPNIVYIPPNIDWLDLNGNHLKGSFPKQLPLNIQVIGINNNKLNGPLESSWPNSLWYLDLQGNSINGTVPSFVFGQNVIYLNNNFFTGAIASTLPITTKIYSVGYNYLTGSIPILPEGILWAIFWNNDFSGFVPQIPNTLIWGLFGGNSLTSALPNLESALALQWLHVGNNQLSGSIPSFPSGLLKGEFQFNYFSGSLPCSIPNLITHLDFWSNLLSGGIPILPTSLTYLNLCSNLLTGSIPVLPSGLQFALFTTNLLTGGIPSPLPQTLQILSFADNKMSGKVPIFPDLIQSVYLGYPGYTGNRFTGTLRIHQPVDLYINDNLISNVIIDDTSLLKGCDLSNNPLLGNATITGLPCVELGLYNYSKTSILALAITSTAKQYTCAPNSISLQTSIYSITSATMVSHKPLTSLSATPDISSEQILTTFAKTIAPTTKTSNYKTTAHATFYQLMTASTNKPTIPIQIETFTSLPMPLNTSFIVSVAPTLLIHTQFVATQSTPLSLHHISRFISISSNASNEDTLVPMSETSTIQIQVDPQVVGSDNQLIIYLLIAGIASIFFILVIGSHFLKHPQSKSKFGRKNSFGTLNTIQTKDTNKS